MEITVMAIGLTVLSLYLMHDGSGLNWQARATRIAMERRDAIRDRPVRRAERAQRVEVRRRRRRFGQIVGGLR